jgi:hypothetical protein
MTHFLLARDADFAARFNVTPFAFRHVLHESGMFELEQLVELAKRLPRAYASSEAAGVGDGWGSDPRKLPVSEVVAALAHTNSLVLLKGLADDAQYGPVVRGVLEEVIAGVGPRLGSDIKEFHATLVLSSPGRVTPYHIDAEANFLLQLGGSKAVSVFDPADRTLLTDWELERFYSGDVSAARYDAARQSEAYEFPFAAGDGLHIPLLAPHWVRNGDSVSVALSINCSLRSNDRLGDIYRVNAFLRRRGLRPGQPGRSPLADGVKVGLARVRALLRSKPAAPGVNAG